MFLFKTGERLFALDKLDFRFLTVWVSQLTSHQRAVQAVDHSSNQTASTVFLS